MSETTAPAHAAEAREWLGRLLSGGAARREAAERLARLGVGARGSVRTRGSLGSAAANRLPDPDRLSDVLRCLEDGDPEVRRAVAAALGEWGGGEAAAALARVLESDADEEVRLACVAALRTLGGPVATEALRRAAGGGEEAVRRAAVAAVEELMTGGRLEDAEAPPEGAAPAAAAAAGPVRVRGAVRTRSGAEPLGALAQTLRAIGEEDTASPYLKSRAARLLRSLGRQAAEGE